jgi:hypothetical protein
MVLARTIHAIGGACCVQPCAGSQPIARCRSIPGEPAETLCQSQLDAGACGQLVHGRITHKLALQARARLLPANKLTGSEMQAFVPVPRMMPISVAWSL